MVNYLIKIIKYKIDFFYAIDTDNVAIIQLKDGLFGAYDIISATPILT